MRKKTIHYVMIGLVTAAVLLPGCVVVDKLANGPKHLRPDPSLPEMTTDGVMPLTNAVPIR